MFAPNIDQMHVINHLKGEPSEEKRNVLVESARLARGNIQDLSKLSVKDHDAIIVPGHYKYDNSTLSNDSPSDSPNIVCFSMTKEPIYPLYQNIHAAAFVFSLKTN